MILRANKKHLKILGKAVLYDDRTPRPVERRIHMMDEGQFGFYRWHIFIRTAALLNLESEMWIHVDRHLGLACTIDRSQSNWQLQLIKWIPEGRTRQDLCLHTRKRKIS